jgi:hypothetical protein
MWSRRMSLPTAAGQGGGRGRPGFVRDGWGCWPRSSWRPRSPSWWARSPASGPRAEQPAATATGSGNGTPGRDRGPADPQAAPGDLLSRTAGSPPATRAGLLSVVQQAYVHGVSTRAVDRLAEEMELKGSPRTRSAGSARSWTPRFTPSAPDAWTPSTHTACSTPPSRRSARTAGWCPWRCSRRCFIAVGGKSAGEREILGVDVRPAEDQQFWLSFMRDLVSRGATGVKLVTSYSHLGLRAALSQVFTGATWQRCRVHFMRNALSSIPKQAQQMVAAMVRTIRPTGTAPLRP